MVTRKQISLIYRHNDNWIGGTYYILNIIRSLHLLDDKLKPELVILYNVDSSIQAVKDIQYPYISFRKLELSLNIFQKIINKCFQKLNGKTIFKFKLPDDLVENIYPLKPNISDANKKNAYYWIPDFQEHYYPEFFSKFDLKLRRESYIDLLDSKSDIVFSSMNALNDYNIFFPGNHNKKKVLNFASFISEDYKNIDVTELFSKFDISKPYFMVSNQFWKHKNHWVILKALVIILRSKISDFQVIFTGKEYDHRNPEYVNELKSFINDNDINRYVKFLGFIDRDEQLMLMSRSLAIIQPSLFEGWSTVVEDSKVLNIFIFVSDIPLHREQIKSNCIFFDPNDPDDLAKKIILFRQNDKVPLDTDYAKYQSKFAADFIDLFE